MEQDILDFIRNEYLDEEDEEDIELTAETPLITSGIVDSFSMVSLKRFVEEHYEVTIPDEDATPDVFDTVASIVHVVETLRKGD
ncbi:MAG: acyl carrier protein [Gemmatimonadota bacterium]|nr:hypothetical protein [Gemmatimonadota bacterium]MDP6529586.1 acyl carrier protein [Gemmatimonadota bacterium]MDP6803111.1 acyl carrier protein [Gemmatimonadota bacterium]MDP7031890.1 acyl carrier protein [Gemmatimonadota bacterium]